MKTIDTRVTTYDPEIVGSGYVDDQYNTAIMSPVEDGTGDWVYICEHEKLISQFQQRIVYLENCLYEANQMLCR